MLVVAKLRFEIMASGKTSRVYSNLDCMETCMRCSRHSYPLLYRIEHEVKEPFYFITLGFVLYGIISLT